LLHEEAPLMRGFVFKWVTSSGGHCGAGFCALPAGACTFLAVYHLVLPAFVAAGAANCHADTAGGLRLLTSQAHELRRSIANGCALHIQLNASCHHLYVFFLRTGGCAVIADRSATEACLNALLVFMVSGHCFIFSGKSTSDFRFIDTEAGRKYDIVFTFYACYLAIARFTPVVRELLLWLLLLLIVSLLVLAGSAAFFLIFFHSALFYMGTATMIPHKRPAELAGHRRS
jgi:hypothetical protein